MLLQSQNGELDILPALPKVWDKGTIRGLRARGGFEVDIEWENNTMKNITIKSLLGNLCTLRYNDKSVNFETEKDQLIRLDENLE